jgi:16S rRNA processing protein RimM
VVGLVRGVHALRGRLRVEVLTDRPEDRFRRGTVLHPEGSDEVLTVAEARPVADGPGWWVRFRELPERAAAERLRGAYLEVEADPDTLAPDEFWWHEVVGTPVVDTAGGALGTVADVYRAGGAEVLLVRDGPLGELDIANVASVVREFDPRGGRIVVDVGALDLEPPAARLPRGRRSRRAAFASGGDQGGRAGASAGGATEDGGLGSSEADA